MKFNTAIVLAGGKSSRMGFDKQEIKIKDKYLVERIIENLKKDFDDIIVVSKNEEIYKDLNIKVTKDLLPSKGPLSGIHAGLSFSESEYAFVMACDMPYYSSEYMKLLVSKINKGDNGIITKHEDGWIEPFHGFYHKNLIEPIAEYINSGQRRIMELIKKEGVQFLSDKFLKEIDPDMKIFENLNTREELEAFLELN